MRSSEDVLQHFKKCPVCDQKYQNIRMLLVYKNRDRTGFHVSCSSCRASVLIFIQPGRMGVVSVGMITDLTAQEARLKMDRPVISPDMVLDVYKDIQSFPDKVNSLLAKTSLQKPKRKIKA